MAGLASLLPKPKNLAPSHTAVEADDDDEFVAPAPKPKKAVPPYGLRGGWIPRSLEDFGDGGAFPEIHVAQFPFNMGRKRGEAGKTLTLQVDVEGNIKYDALATQGLGKDRVVHSKFTDLVPTDIKEGDKSFELPSEEDVKETTDRTRLALEKMLEGKIKAKMPKQAVQQTNDPTYIRYNPVQQGAGFNSGAESRVIRMVEVPKDPMEPPKFRHKKIPRGPPSPPAPVMHSPPRKVSVEEQNAWKIPPSISNWKNPKGYTIALDKRLASDGRGLQESYISDGFAKLSQALVQAERSAHEEVRLRALVDNKIKEKKTLEQEDRIRNLAQQAREEKLGKMAAAKAELSEAERDELKEREEIRHDKQKEIEREFRMSRMSAENRIKLLERDKDRDVSEKIALGLARPTASGAGQETMYDQRLFNRSQGVSAGGGDEESYSLYDRPLFGGAQASSIYRPKREHDDDFTGSESDVKRLVNTERFVADKGFQGADAAQKRSGPVEFEAAQEDPFGLDQFMKEARQGKRAAAGAAADGKGDQQRSRDSRGRGREDDEDELERERDAKRRR